MRYVLLPLLLPTIGLFFFLYLPTHIRLTLHDATLRLRFGFLRGLLPLLFTISLRRDANGKLALRLFFFRRPLKTQRHRPAPVHPLEVLSRIHLHLRAFSLDCTLGLADDAAMTALLCGLLRSALLALLAPLTARERHPPRLRLHVAPAYSRNALSVHASALFSVSTLALLKALLRSCAASKAKTRTAPSKAAPDA